MVFILPIIGITTRVDTCSNILIRKVSSSLISIVESLGGIPLIIPEVEDISILNDIIKLCNGFIIPGGAYFSKLDLSIINYALQEDIPLLGICAGMQALANYKNNVDKTLKVINHNYPDTDYVHEIFLSNSLLKGIFHRSKIMVNSKHNYRVQYEPFFLVDATSSDGVIEAIHIPDKKFIVGVQWHPESTYDKYSKKLFTAFIKACERDI